MFKFILKYGVEVNIAISLISAIASHKWNHVSLLCIMLLIYLKLIIRLEMVEDEEKN